MSDRNDSQRRGAAHRSVRTMAIAAISREWERSSSEEVEARAWTPSSQKSAQRSAVADARPNCGLVQLGSISLDLSPLHGLAASVRRAVTAHLAPTETTYLVAENAKPRSISERGRLYRNVKS